MLRRLIRLSDIRGVTQRAAVSFPSGRSLDIQFSNAQMYAHEGQAQMFTEDRYVRLVEGGSAVDEF